MISQDHGWMTRCCTPGSVDTLCHATPWTQRALYRFAINVASHSSVVGPSGKSWEITVFQSSTTLVCCVKYTKIYSLRCLRHSN